MAGRPRRDWDWSPTQLSRLAQIIKELERRPEYATQELLGAAIGRDQGAISRAKAGTPTEPVARALCALYDPKRPMEDLLGPGVPRKPTPTAFRTIRSDIRAGVVTGAEALRAAILVAQDEPWWHEDAELLAASYSKRHPKDAAEMTPRGWMAKLQEWSELLEKSTT